MATVVEINEAVALTATPRDVAERYAGWAVHRPGVTGGGLAAPARAECSDADHAREVVAMLTEWGVPRKALKVREVD